MGYEVLLPFFYEWIDRKMHAKVQRRVGPPLLQPIYDFIKLFKKEVIIPHGKKLIFVLAPPLLLINSVLAMFLALNRVNYVVLFLITLFLLDILIKTFLAYSVKSPYSMQGMSRLAGLKMALDPAFPLSVLAPAFLFGFNPISWPMVAVGFFPLALIASMAELEMTPFDIPTAEGEIASGWKAELSGVLLACVNYAHYAKAVAASALLAYMWGPNYFFLKSLGIFSFMVLLSSLLPRFSVKKLIKYLTILNIVAMLEVIISLNLY
ncbi:MAG: NADH-quinone oxidoreductase subunit H [Candidatus Altiarchaeota archaeon]|nr:NADH-quinone oxidoreductase subunit H [Candidatus Altiarchaeota archaeon]